jgi:hypothetical protein
MFNFFKALQNSVVIGEYQGGHLSCSQSACGMNRFTFDLTSDEQAKKNFHRMWWWWVGMKEDQSGGMIPVLLWSLQLHIQI